jgi:hypothetical protein
MANSKYAQVQAMAASGQLNWNRDRIIACLFTGGTFNSAHTRLSQVGGQQHAVSAIGSRYVGIGGEAVGMPAVFDRVAKETDYQVFVVVDHGGGVSPGLIAFYDQDTNAGPLRTVNNGSFVLRPVAYVDGNPESIGTWFIFG